MLSTPPATNSVTLAGAHAARGVQHGGEAAAAQAVDRQPARSDRQPGQQRRVARDVAAVLAGLAGAAGNDVLDILRGEGVALEQPGDHRGEQVVRTYPGQRAGVPAEGGPQSVVDEGGGGHGGDLRFRVW